MTAAEKKTKPWGGICRCSTDCSKGLSFTTRAPLAESFPDRESCACTCHAFAIENVEARKRQYAAGYRWRYQE